MIFAFISPNWLNWMSKNIQMFRVSIIGMGQIEFDAFGYCIWLFLNCCYLYRIFFMSSLFWYIYCLMCDVWSFWIANKICLNCFIIFVFMFFFLFLTPKQNRKKLNFYCSYSFTEFRNRGAQRLSCISRNILRVFRMGPTDDACHHRKYTLHTRWNAFNHRYW